MYFVFIVVEKRNEKEKSIEIFTTTAYISTTQKIKL